MDTFINLAKQGFEKYEESQKEGQKKPQDGQKGEYDKTGGEEYNSPDHADGGRPHPQPGHHLDLDESHVVNTAKEHGTKDDDLFSQGFSFIKSKLGGGVSHEIDEEGVQEAHSEVYEKGNAGSLDASALGSAAALQALKNFTSGGSSSTGGSSGGGNTQSKLIGLAMAEASKLFDSKGASGGNKQDAVNGAAETVLKLLLKSKFKSVVGGSDSGGLGGLAGLAGKFI